MTTKVCRACEGPLCPYCGGCIQEGECMCWDELESEAAREYKKLKAKLDQLLGVCETIHEWLGTDDAAQALPFEPPWYEQLRDAIAKARSK